MQTMRRIEPGTFHGKILMIRKAPGLTVAVAERPGSLDVPEHTHALPSLVSLLKGEHSFSDDYGQERVSRMGSWYYRPADVVQRHRPQPTSIRSLCLEFDPAAFRLNNLPTVEQVLDSPPALMLSEKVMVELMRGDPASDLMLIAYAMQTIGLLVREGRPIATLEVPTWLLSVREIVHERFADRLKLEDVATEVGIHPAHLSRAFRNAFGIPFSEYLLQVRVAWAHEALRTSNMKIAQIAAEAGFSDHAHLTRVFKQRYGLAPGEFRETVAVVSN